MIMVAIAMDRYFCICHPFLHVVTVPRAKGCIAVLTFLAVLMGVIPALGHGVYELEPSPSPQNPSNTSFLSNQTLSESFFPDSAFSVSNHSNLTDDYAFDNFTFSSTEAPVPNSLLQYVGICFIDGKIISEEDTLVYQKFYAGAFLVELIIIIVLYALIYHSIIMRRAWKAKRKRNLSYYITNNGPDQAGEETQLTTMNGGANTEVQQTQQKGNRMSTNIRDRTLYANIKTAAMLFVVTVFFVIAYLPSWLMGLKQIPFNIIIFYIFYINNVCNPIIYAFMNRTFRDDMFQLMKNCMRR